MSTRNKKVKKGVKTAQKAYKEYKESGGKVPSKKVIIAIAIILIVAIVAACVLYFFVFNKKDDGAGTNGGSAGGGGVGGGSSGGGLTPGAGETLSIDFINVGQGDCIYIEFPDGKNMVIDGGENNSTVTGAIDNFISQNNITSLNYVLLTHTDSDHSGSLDYFVGKMTSVEKAFVPKIETKETLLELGGEYKTIDTVVYNTFIQSVQNSKYVNGDTETPTAIEYTVDVITIESTSYKFTMYCRSEEYYKTFSTSNAKDKNDVSPICVLEFANRKILFTGDANSAEENTKTLPLGSSESNFLYLLEQAGVSESAFDADVLKVAHHGSGGASGQDFLSFVDAEYGVVCVGDGVDSPREPYNAFINNGLIGEGYHYSLTPENKYGHPTADVCGENGRLKTSGFTDVYYTSTNGNVNCTVDASGNIVFTSEKVPSKEADGVVVFVEYNAPQNLASVFVCPIRKEYL